MKSLRWLFLLWTGFAVAQQPAIRVHLLSLYHLRQITIIANPSAKWRDGGTLRTLSAPMIVHAEANGVSVGGKPLRRITVEGDFTVEGDSFRPLKLHVPIELTSRHGELWMIALFPVEDYVSAALQGESAGDMPPEALKAMAVAIRSYATRLRDRHKEEGFDFCDTTHCQYLRTEIVPAVRSAAEQTANELLWNRGSPLAAYYHKDCGGRTEDAAALWPDQKSRSLISHEDPYCRRVSKDWRAEVSRADIDDALASAKLRTPLKWDRIVIKERTASGRTRSLELAMGGSQLRVEVSASSFRFALGRKLGWNTLKSDWYEVNSSGDHFVFVGRGTGHGVGLCQVGAAEMARAGKTYGEILAFYYPEAMTGRSAQGIPWETTRAVEMDIRTVHADDVATVKDAANSALAWARERTGLVLENRPTIDVFPTVTMFRDATGEPGWVAASTKDEHIRVQPPAVLKGRLGSLLRHEFLHLLVESHAKAGTPLWFREGLVIYLSGEKHPVATTMTPRQIEDAITSRQSRAEVTAAYAAATEIFRKLDEKYGRMQLMQWLRSGLPSNLLAVHPDKIAQ